MYKKGLLPDKAIALSSLSRPLPDYLSTMRVQKQLIFCTKILPVVHKKCELSSCIMTSFERFWSILMGSIVSGDTNSLFRYYL